MTNGGLMVHQILCARINRCEKIQGDGGAIVVESMLLNVRQIPSPRPSPRLGGARETESILPVIGPHFQSQGMIKRWV